jgi:hypothetical protein
MSTPRYKHCANFASFELFWIETYSLYSFTSIANQKSVRYSVSISYFTNIAVQNVNKVRACAQGWTSSLNIFARNLSIIKSRIFKKCLLFRCRHAVVIMQTLNWTNQCPLSWQSAIFLRSVRMTTHPTPLVTHARDNWWTLDSANAFVSPGVNSRGELVPSHGASRRRLGDNREL